MPYFFAPLFPVHNRQIFLGVRQNFDIISVFYNTPVKIYDNILTMFWKDIQNEYL